MHKSPKPSNLKKSPKPGKLKKSLTQAFRRKIARNTLNCWNPTDNAASTTDLLADDNSSVGSGVQSATNLLKKQTLMLPVPEHHDITTKESPVHANRTRNQKRLSQPVNLLKALTARQADSESFERPSSQGLLDPYPGIKHGNRTINLTMTRKDVLVKKRPLGTVIHKVKH